jgi:hypothetical protein
VSSNDKEWYIIRVVYRDTHGASVERCYGPYETSDLAADEARRYGKYFRRDWWTRVLGLTVERLQPIRVEFGFFEKEETNG